MISDYMFGLWFNGNAEVQRSGMNLFSLDVCSKGVLSQKAEFRVTFGSVRRLSIRGYVVYVQTEYPFAYLYIKICFLIYLYIFK